MELQARLRLSVKWKRADILRQLLHDPEIEQASATPALRSALLLALKKDGAEVVQMLLDYGVLVDDLSLTQSHLFSQEFEDWLKIMKQKTKLQQTFKSDSFYPIVIQLKSIDSKHERDIIGAKYWRKLMKQCKKNQDSHHVIHLREEAKLRLSSSPSWQGIMYRDITETLQYLKFMEVDHPQVEHLKVRKNLLVLDRIYHNLLGEHFRYKTGMMSAHWDLFLWAVLMNRQALAEVLWERTSTPMVAALTAAILNRRLMAHCEVKTEVRERLTANADAFEQVQPHCAHVRGAALTVVIDALIDSPLQSSRCAPWCDRRRPCLAQMAVAIMLRARQEDNPLALRALERPHGLW